MKLGDDEADLARVPRQRPAARRTACPRVPSILPNTVIEGPDDVEERIEAICASLRRFARYEPDCVLCLTGPAGGRAEGEARGLVDRRAAPDRGGGRRGRRPARARADPRLAARRPDARHDDPGGARPARRGGPAGRRDHVRPLALWDTPDDRTAPARERRPDHGRPRRRTGSRRAATTARSRARRLRARADARPPRGRLARRLGRGDLRRPRAARLALVARRRRGRAPRLRRGRGDRAAREGGRSGRARWRRRPSSRRRARPRASPSRPGTTPRERAAGRR